jgi:GNAT superfamily N-acetyltransferase
MAEPLIRTASEADIGAMLDLWRTLEDVQGPYRLFPMVPGPEGRIAMLLKEAIVEPDSEVFVVEGSSRLVGMAVARVSDQGHHSMSSARVVELSRVVVDPSARGTGLGRALVEAAGRFGASRDAAFITAKLFTGNVEGRAFWERMGFISRFEERIKPIGSFDAADILDAEEAD